MRYWRLCIASDPQSGSAAGNIGSASPIGDLIPVMISLEAGIILKSSSAEREMPVEDFITGYRTTELKPDEIIHSFRIPKSAISHTIRFFKVSKRRELDISTVSMSARLEFNLIGSIDKAILAFGGMAAKTSRASNAEKYLKGKEWNRETAEEAAKLVTEEFNPISDARSGKEARKIMAGNLLRKLYVETTSNIRQDAYKSNFDADSQHHESAVSHVTGKALLSMIL
ncbi:MAG: FAD binding domain-containing protein [Bacteroidales bacterium]|nr:FAD binding domain-containing protein [Bacteroidales bacterium]